jgi:hypothetical protein
VGKSAVGKSAGGGGEARRSEERGARGGGGDREQGEVVLERVESDGGNESRAKAREAGRQTREGGRITAVIVFYVPIFFSTSYFLGVEINQSLVRSALNRHF